MYIVSAKLAAILSNLYSVMHIVESTIFMLTVGNFFLIKSRVFLF